MARLNDEGQPDSVIHVSDHMLSPQPRAPPGKEHLLTSFETSHLPNENGYTIDDVQMTIQDYEYSSSSSSARHSTSDIFGREMDAELDQMKSRASSSSSLSSIPASVLIHPKAMAGIPALDSSAGYTLEEDEMSFGEFEGPPKSIRTIRQREAAFRKPSSVRAMQMHTEDEADDDEYLTPPRRRAGIRSPGTSPLKRSPYYSPNAPPNKPQPKVQKEYPLVLLHCNLLAPSLPVPGAALPQNQKLVEETLPPEYWKRWRRLQDKVGSGVLRDRGVLISHPEDLYDILEERLLESLELQRSRLQQGHFVGHEESGPGSEGELSDQGESETDGEQDEECPDCGGRVRHGDSNRKWEIKVFAANGLMRAGAWAAAWKEMEKVDVEVGLWLPSDIRRDLEKRLAEEHAATSAEELLGSPLIHQATQFAMDPRRTSIHTHSRAVSDAVSFRASVPPSVAPSANPTNPEMNFSQAGREKQHEVALQTLLVNYIRVLASDRRNVALAFMSILVMFLAIGSYPQQLPLQPFMHSLPREMAESPVILTVTDAPFLSTATSSALMFETIGFPFAASSIMAAESAVSSSTEEPASTSILGEPEAQPIEPTESTEPLESAAHESAETAEPETQTTEAEATIQSVPEPDATLIFTNEELGPEVPPVMDETEAEPVNESVEDEPEHILNVRR
ncbi:uncharacterized protein N7498_005782 [Penicillium cinerascens]|uniref:Pathway-specific nitrogen regulator n=1 Tax=Penicillium cinerascens TaxID=70096 RepID=A0A9W9T0G7_9EURO|nr:uncharacterized protein N7498_005782 [Penicillium cinerascens]KAJ5204903.1 hypothetical protein N7498_005782 [Penicillium cinerascens]